MLRPYQEEMVQGIRAAFKRHRRVLAVAPTGAGKTVMFSHIAKGAVAKGSRVIIQAHRSNIVDQISESLDQFGIRHGRIQPGHSMTDDLCQVAMVQSLSRRLARVHTPRLIVTDEAHHAVAAQHKAILEAWPDALSLGVTATPQGSDGKGLDECYDEMVEGPQMADLIAGGYLAKYRYLAPPQQVDLSGIKTRGGDYAIDELAEAMNRASITGCAVSHYRQHMDGRPAIVFCVNVKHAEATAAQFRSAGYKAASIDGTMDRADQSRMLAAIGNGGLNVLTSCQLIGEGTNIPTVAGVIMLNPTKSIVVYLQGAGRALRLKPDGSDAVILDHAGNVYRHGMPDMVREWSLAGAPKKEAAPPVKQCPECFAMFKPAPVCPECGHSFEKEIKEARELDVIAGELAEIDAARMEALRKKPLHELLTGRESFADLEEIRKARKYHPMWSRHVMRERKARVA